MPAKIWSHSLPFVAQHLAGDMGYGSENLQRSDAKSFHTIEKRITYLHVLIHEDKNFIPPNNSQVTISKIPKTRLNISSGQ